MVLEGDVCVCCSSALRDGLDAQPAMRMSEVIEVPITESVGCVMSYRSKMKPIGDTQIGFIYAFLSSLSVTDGTNGDLHRLLDSIPMHRLVDR